MPRWNEWDGAKIVPEHGFAWIDVVNAEGDDIGSYSVPSVCMSRLSRTR
jgi:hypothetical protein